jgi:hypothetical protein
MVPNLVGDPELVADVVTWSQSGRTRPDVEWEPRIDGLRVKLTHLGVESGVVFVWGDAKVRESVPSTLDRLYEILAWRVTRPPVMRA